MELFMFRHTEWERLYNCSNAIGAGRTIDGVIPLEKRLHFVPEAWLTIGLSAIYYALYLPCLCSIWRHSRRPWNPCYQMLLYIGLLDLVILAILGPLHGWLALHGAIFCSHPVLIYWAGLGCTAIWMAVSTADLALAINRCLEILSPHLAARFFAGWRVFIWLSACSAYALYWLLFVKPVTFSSLHFAWFFNPFVGLKEDTAGIFSTPLHSFHDLLVAIASPAIYTIFIVILVFKTSASKKISYSQKMTFLQVFILSGMNTMTGILYVVMQHMEPRQWMITLAEFAWFHIHAFPPVIYLIFNKTIRNDCRRMLSNIYGANGNRVMTTQHTSSKKRRNIAIVGPEREQPITNQISVITNMEE